VTLKGFGQRPIIRSFDFGRSNQIETILPYQPKQADFLRILLGHDFFIGKARLWLAERAKSRGSHGGAPETGFKDDSFRIYLGRLFHQLHGDGEVGSDDALGCRV
jgi:hypothetical protein